MSDDTGIDAPAPAPLTGIALRPLSAIALATLCILLNAVLAWVAGSTAAAGVARGLVAGTGRSLAVVPKEGAALVIGVAMIALYGLTLLPTLLIVRARGLRFADAVGLRPFRPGPVVVGAFAVTASACCLVVPYAIAVSGLGIEPGNTDVLVRAFGGGPIGVTVLLLTGTVVAPFVEEVTFRGMLFGSLSHHWQAGWAVLVSSALFGLAHLDPVNMVPTALVGALLAVVFSKGRSLWYSVAAHGMYNAAVLLLALLAARAT